MDIYCVRCGEPTDIDELHQRAGETQSSFKFVQSDYYARGCEALGYPKCDREESLDNEGRLSASLAMSTMVDLLGEDIDGIASMMEDLGY
jgi:hypothetical protein